MNANVNKDANDIQIDSNFDGGNIEVLSVEGAGATLAIRADHLSEFRQWFHFRASGAAGREITLKITGLESSAYPLGWPSSVVPRRREETPSLAAHSATRSW